MSEQVQPMESWRRVWRNGFAKVLPVAGLEALRVALVEDDPRLLQGCTTNPPALRCTQDWTCEGGCAVSYCGWKGEGRGLLGDVAEFFSKCCDDADYRLGEPAACRWFLNWFDDTPRDEMRRELLPEVERAIAERSKQ
jgi:hypothetical protein